MITRGGSRLVEALGRTHRGLDGDGTDVLPVLLEQGDQEVDGLVSVLDDLVLGHADVADGDNKRQDL